MCIEENLKKGLLVVIGFIFILIITTIALPKFFHRLDDACGITAVASGAVCDKNYLAAHSDTTWVLFVSSTTFHPEEWQIQIRIYDSATKKWATAKLDVDKTTYDSLSIGEQYKDPLNRSAYFSYDS